jgi:hypothetical protein
VLVYGKGGTDRAIPVSDELAEPIKAAWVPIRAWPGSM